MNSTLLAIIASIILPLGVLPTGSAYVVDHADVLTSNQEILVSEFLENLDGVEPQVEFLSNFGGLTEAGWLEQKETDLDLSGDGTDVVYLGVSTETRGMWFILGDTIAARVSDEDLSQIYSLYMVPDFKDGYYGYGSAAGFQAVYDVYSGLSVFESQFAGFQPAAAEVVPEPEVIAPVNEEPTNDYVAPTVEVEEEPLVPPAFLPFLFLALVIVSVIFFGVMFLVKKTADKKKKALQAIADKRIRRLTNDIVFKLKKNDEFIAATVDEKLELMSKSLNSMFGVKDGDSPLVIEAASLELLNPSETISA